MKSFLVKVLQKALSVLKVDSLSINAVLFKKWLFFTIRLLGFTTLLMTVVIKGRELLGIKEDESEESDTDKKGTK